MVAGMADSEGPGLHEVMPRSKHIIGNNCCGTSFGAIEKKLKQLWGLLLLN
jgi:hypothetical protein